MNKNDKQRSKYDSRDNSTARGKSRGTAGARENTKGKGSRSRRDNRRNSDADGSPKATGNSSKLSSLNDLSWYDKNPLLVQASASIPFPYRPGMELPLGEMGPQFDQKASITIPGVIAINYDLSVGYSDSVTSPISLAAKEMYARVRDKFSGTLPEDAPDILIYMMCMDSIFNAISEMKRIYRVLNAYTPYNYQVPDTLLQAMLPKTATDLTIAHLRANKTLFLQNINELIAMTRKFTVPAIMDIVNRHYWLGSNVYTDDASINSQMYVFRCKHRYIFGLDDKNHVGCLKTTALTFTDAGPVEDMYNYVRSMIEALANSEDAYTINGHLMRAYEGSPMFQLDYLMPDETFDPVFVPEVLSQIENSRAIVGKIDEASLTVVQNPSTNALIHTPTSHVIEGYFNGATNPRVSVRTDSPSPADVVIATRLAAVSVRDGGTDPKLFNIYAGTEIVENYTIYNMQAKDTWHNDLIVDLSGDVATSISGTLGFLAILSQFDWHPIVTMVVKGKNGKFSPAIFGDIHNVTVMDEEVLKNIHNVCVLSEFNAFSMG